MRLYLAAVGCALLLSGCPDKKPKNPTCASDKDCKEGEQCINKQCVVKPKPAGFCDENTPCPDGKVCKNNKCTACTEDRECGPTGRCTDDGTCLERGACNKDEDCADDEDCIEGKCQKPSEAGTGATCELKPVYFGFDRSAIEETSRTDLEASAECIQQSVGQSVVMTGHTDPRGTDEYNIALSESRAQAVADYLARLGIDPARFRIVPKGETEATGTDEGSYGNDRRVDMGWQ